MSRITGIIGVMTEIDEDAGLSRAHRCTMSRFFAICLVLLIPTLVACGDIDNGGGGERPDLDGALSIDAGDVASSDTSDATAPDANDSIGSDVSDTKEAGQADVGDTWEQDGPVSYPPDRSLSPITDSVAARLRDIAGSGPTMTEDVFAKIGASNTVNRNHLHCFAADEVDLDGRDHLQPTIDFFSQGDAAGATPWERESLAATVGWSAFAVLEGDPTPLAQEVSAISPRLGLIHFGTNDIQLRNIYQYADNLMDIADWLLARGVIPVFTSLPPRDDDADADTWVPRYNATMRAVAQAHQVPFIDLHRELVGLPDHGVGGDGIHLNVYRPSGARGCVFTPEGLQYGHNMRNLLTLQTLSRLRGALTDQPAPDSRAPTLSGTGTTSDPFSIQRLPFSDLADTSTGGQRLYDRYDGCDADQDESGTEYVYRIDVDRPTDIRAFVFDRGAVDIDLHLLDSSAVPAGCLQRDHQTITATLQPGTHFFVLDTYVSSGQERAGEYLFVLLEDG